MGGPASASRGTSHDGNRGSFLPFPRPSPPVTAEPKVRTTAAAGMAERRHERTKVDQPKAQRAKRHHERPTDDTVDPTTTRRAQRRYEEPNDGAKCPMTT